MTRAKVKPDDDSGQSRCAIDQITCHPREHQVVQKVWETMLVKKNPALVKKSVQILEDLCAHIVAEVTKAFEYSSVYSTKEDVAQKQKAQDLKWAIKCCSHVRTAMEWFTDPKQHMEVTSVPVSKMSKEQQLALLAELQKQMGDLTGAEIPTEDTDAAALEALESEQQ